MTVLITGGAGFIGSAVAKALMDRGDAVVLVDNFNDYYDPSLKRARINRFLRGYRNARGENKRGRFTLFRADVRNIAMMDRIIAKTRPTAIIHLAAMAGVRASLEDPSLYADVNVVGTTNIFTLAVKYKVKKVLYASSSSVYGELATVPFHEDARVDAPVSPYAATKKAKELMAHAFHRVYGLNVAALRYFTVYGPWGRPDMGVFLFPERILRGERIDVFNRGKMKRDFTYIDDIVRGTVTVLDADFSYDVFNIGGDTPIALMDFIAAAERATGKTARKRLLRMQPGDVPQTMADVQKLRALGWAPTTDIDTGLRNFVQWYKDYYKIS